jgi:hypothetical protein
MRVPVMGVGVDKRTAVDVVIVSVAVAMVRVVMVVVMAVMIMAFMVMMAVMRVVVMMRMGMCMVVVRMLMCVGMMMPVVIVVVMVVRKTMRMSCRACKRKCFHGFCLGRRSRLRCCLPGWFWLPSPPWRGRHQSHGSLVEQP